MPDMRVRGVAGGMGDPGLAEVFGSNGESRPTPRSDAIYDS